MGGGGVNRGGDGKYFSAGRHGNFGRRARRASWEIAVLPMALDIADTRDMVA